ncbi:MAG: RNA polymerase sigma factor [Bacteroidia bacterium]|nr:RNA polymerase sigma factor [Bacteroidia bacterium]
MDPTTQLVEACKNGESSAFEGLYNLYSKAMFNISLRITNDREESEDVLQEAFLSAFKNINQFKGESTFGSWLKRIVINKSIDAVKKRKLKFTEVESIEALNILEEETGNDEIQISYTIEAVTKAIQFLPDGFRTVLTLYLFEDYSHKEIAEKLNISENTSKTQYLRAKKRLIEILSAVKEDVG